MIVNNSILIVFSLYNRVGSYIILSYRDQISSNCLASRIWVRLLFTSPLGVTLISHMNQIPVIAVVFKIWDGLSFILSLVATLSP